MFFSPLSQQGEMEDSRGADNPQGPAPCSTGTTTVGHRQEKLVYILFASALSVVAIERKEGVLGLFRNREAPGRRTTLHQMIKFLPWRTYDPVEPVDKTKTSLTVKEVWRADSASVFDCWCQWIPTPAGQHQRTQRNITQHMRRTAPIPDRNSFFPTFNTRNTTTASMSAARVKIGTGNQRCTLQKAIDEMDRQQRGGECLLNYHIHGGHHFQGSIVRSTDLKRLPYSSSFSFYL